MNFSRQDKKISLLAIGLGFLGFGSVYWLRDSFTYGNEGLCDAWYAFGVNNNLMSAVHDGMTFYRKERLSSVLPRAGFAEIFGPLDGRTLFALTTHIFSLLALALLSLRLFASRFVAITLLILFAFSPLVFGSYHNDFPAMDPVMWSLWAFYFAVLSIQADSVSQQMKMIFLCAFLWGLAFVAHFKFGLYGVFIPLMPFLKMSEISSLAKFKKKLVFFSLGFLACFFVLGGINKFILHADFYFFHNLLLITLMRETGMNRPWTDTLMHSPMYILYAFIMVALLHQWSRRRWTELEWGISASVLLLVVFIISGGIFFVESNYVWALLPALLLLGRLLQNASISAKLRNLLLLIVVLSVPLVFVRDFFLSEWLLENLGSFYPLWIGLILWGALQGSLNRKNSLPSVLVFGLISASFFLIRPDHYGKSLFVSDAPASNSQKTYQTIIDFFALVRQYDDSRFPFIFNEGLKSPLLEAIESSYIQCGLPFQMNFNQFNDFIEVGLRKKRVIAYFSAQPDQQRLQNYFLTRGYQISFLDKRTFELEDQAINVLFFRSKPPEKPSS